jgi:hypothetical protein
LTASERAVQIAGSPPVRRRRRRWACGRIIVRSGGREEKGARRQARKADVLQGLGPLLTEFDGLATDLGTARSKKGWQPENIKDLSPKATKVGKKAYAVACDYRAASGKAGWDDMAQAALRIEADLGRWLEIEPKHAVASNLLGEVLLAQRQPERARERFASAKTADDLRKLMQKKGDKINDDQALLAQLDKFDLALRQINSAAANDEADVVKGKVDRVLKDPAHLAGVAQQAREDVAKMVKGAKRLVDLRPDPELRQDERCEQSAAAKTRAEALPKQAPKHPTVYTAACVKANGLLATLPSG